MGMERRLLIDGREISLCIAKIYVTDQMSSADILSMVAFTALAGGGDIEHAYGVG